MLHTCVQRFDVTENLEKFCKILETKQALRWAMINLPPLTSVDTFGRIGLRFCCTPVSLTMRVRCLRPGAASLTFLSSPYTHDDVGSGNRQACCPADTKAGHPQPSSTRPPPFLKVIIRLSRTVRSVRGACGCRTACRSPASMPVWLPALRWHSQKDAR
jgi:hypothetical protein